MRCGIGGGGVRSRGAGIREQNKSEMIERKRRRMEVWREDEGVGDRKIQTNRENNYCRL